MGRGFHTLAWICCASIAALLATAESLALGQEAPHISVGEGPADETSFEDGFSKFDVIPPPHDHPEDAVDITEFEPISEPAAGDVLRDLGIGHASYYGRRFAGRPTASGEQFNPRQFTAAHKTLPFGSKVRVTNPRNGRSVIVRINDRGPFVSGRTIDLSRAAAEEIGLVKRGVGEVHMELLAP